jgi:hypothetical protein
MSLINRSFIGLLASVLMAPTVARPVWPVEKKEWAAKWIWNSGEANPTNYFLMVRKNFELASKPDLAILYITSANRYKVFLNGKYIF